MHLQIFVKDYDGLDSDKYYEVQLAKRLFPESRVHWVVFPAANSAPAPH
jgi:hypothetical protein